MRMTTESDIVGLSEVKGDDDYMRVSEKVKETSRIFDCCSD